MAPATKDPGGPKTHMNTKDHNEVFPAIKALDVQDPIAATDRPGHALISRIGGERATQGPGNKIVTVGDKTHVVWQDSYRERYFARIRTLDHSSNSWLPGEVLMEGIDEHSRPVLAVDPEGILHVVMGGHNSPLQYRHSLQPNDSSAWSPVIEFGCNTYPVLMADGEGSLILTARSGSHDGMELWKKKRDGNWTLDYSLIERGPGFSNYSAFYNAMAWGPDRQNLHLSTGMFLGYPAKEAIHIRHFAGTYQGVAYLTSPDSGKTWQTSKGVAVSLPATPRSMDILTQSESNNPKPGIKHGGMAVDSENKPYLAYVRHNPNPGSVHLMTLDTNNGWVELPLQAFIRKTFPGKGLLDIKITATPGDLLCMIAILIPLEHPDANWNPGIYGLPDYWTRDFPDLPQLAWIESSDYGQSFNTREVFPADTGVGRHLPTLQRLESAGARFAGTRPALLYFEGDSSYPSTGGTLDNDVYFVQP